MVSQRTSNWDRNLYFFCLGIYVLLCLASIFSGITSWDEETDYLGIRTQIAHAIEVLRGQSPDYKDIHSDLEYYGAAALLPAWLLWFFQQSFLIGRLPLSKAIYDPSAEHQLTGFFSNAHLITGVEFVILSLLVIKISQKLGCKLQWLAGALLLFQPTLLGHSFVNLKDIPFALFYTTYTLSLILRARSSKYVHLSLSLISASLLVNLKFVAILPIFLSEGLLLFIQTKKVRNLSRTALLLLAVPSFALLMQPASWGLNPIDYIREAFNTFSNHGWGGCMTWLNECIGINHPDWSTSRYIWNWLSIKVPLLWIFLLVYQCLYTLSKPSLLCLRTLWLPVFSQILLIPLLAIARQSNLYDADRHLMFIYPALAVVCALAIQNILSLSKKAKVNSLMKLLLLFLSTILLWDSLSLNPYQSSYINEFSRFSHNHKTTSLDYWGVSSKELIRNSQINGSLQTPPVLTSGIWISPFWISYRQLSGQISSNTSLSPLYQLRVPSDFRTPPEERECVYASEVSRRIFPLKKLTLSKLYLCKIA